MNDTAKLSCRCGKVSGRVIDASPQAASRIVCYCDDCQAFLHHLGRADLLDAHGGTDVVQVAPASVAFDRGAEQIVGLRLTPKGLYRFYAACCNTPLGNTLSPAIPFVGIVAQAFEDADRSFGKPVGAILGKFAVGTPPAGSTRMNLPLLASAVRKVLGWRLRGKAWPHPFFDRETRKPIRPITVLTNDEREALRPLCGPRDAPPESSL
ncbi:MAG TPA: DUF6151 family protein [Gammaproteobacteria bacterium]|nr:DUF6151 family protein [Gammaproteobacteria bacterium]